MRGIKKHWTVPISYNFKRADRGIFKGPSPYTKLYHGRMADVSPKYGKKRNLRDHLTLQAAADLFNVEFVVISSLGPAATTVISPQNSVPISSFYIGHFQKEMVSTMSPCKTMPCGRNEWKKDKSDEVPESDNNATQEKNSVTSEVAAEESHVQENTNQHTSQVTSDGDNQTPTLPPNQCSSSFEGSMGVLNQDILEEIIRQTLAMSPYMRQPLRAVSRFFRDTVDKQPLPKVYIPELNNILDICHVCVRKIMLLKGKASGAVIRLREIINHVKWASAWISFVALGQCWFGISSIFWRNGK